MVARHDLTHGCDRHARRRHPPRRAPVPAAARGADVRAGRGSTGTGSSPRPSCAAASSPTATLCPARGPASTAHCPRAHARFHLVVTDAVRPRTGAAVDVLATTAQLDDGSGAPATSAEPGSTGALPGDTTDAAARRPSPPVSSALGTDDAGHTGDGNATLGVTLLVATTPGPRAGQGGRARIRDPRVSGPRTRTCPRETWDAG